MMLSFKLVIALLLAFTTVKGCHHPKEEFEEDEFPDSQRRKREVARATDADSILSRFFSKCMFEKTGRVFDSWTAVIDFILRDTRWYSATDEQYCKENQETDRLSRRCWMNRLETLVQIDSRLLPKGKECIEEFGWSYDAGAIYRFRRAELYTSSDGSFPSFPPIPPERCPTVTNQTYQRCVEEDVLTQMNLQEYPSLKNYDPGSIRKFVTDHYTSCRIASRSTIFGNVYSERCPSNRSPVSPNEGCYPLVLGEILRTSSPVYKAATSCTKKFTSTNPCDGVACRPNMHCNPITGTCVCDEGYAMDHTQFCKPTNPCDDVVCRPNMHCNPITGTCVCDEGYAMDHTQFCKPKDLCATKNCDPFTEQCIEFLEVAYCLCKPKYTRNANGKCEPNEPCPDGCDSTRECKVDPRTGDGTCVCRPGFFDTGEECIDSNACMFLFCPHPETCKINSVTGNPECVCKDGYQLNQNKKCVSTDQCDGVFCGPNMHCDPSTGTCVCDPGYGMDHNRICKPDDPCDTVRCCCNKECKVDPFTNLASCQCKSGYNTLPNGDCTEECKHPKVFTTCASGCPATCDKAVPQPCRRACIPNRYCVCPLGYLQFSETDLRCVRPWECPPKNPCATILCPSDKICEVDPETNLAKCVCKKGYITLPNGNCHEGCKHPKVFTPCASGCPATCDEPVPQPCRRPCIPNRYCVCPSGYLQFSETDLRCVRPWQCPPKDPCARIRCKIYSKCEINPETNLPECVCIEGYIPQHDGGCKEDLCKDVICPRYSRCEEGKCICYSGYNKTHDGKCIRCTFPKVFNSCPTYCPITCDNIRSPPTFCPSACRPDVYCVCPPHMVEESSRVSTCIDRRRCRGLCGGISCRPNFHCQNGECVCSRGYKIERGNCVKDPCYRVPCFPFSTCVNGKCLCIPRYILTGFRKCTRLVT